MNVLGAIVCAKRALKADGMLENLFGLLRKYRSGDMWLWVGLVGACDVEVVRGRDWWGRRVHLGKWYLIDIKSEHIFWQSLGIASKKHEIDLTHWDEFVIELLR